MDSVVPNGDVLSQGTEECFLLFLLKYLLMGDVAFSRTVISN